MRRFAVRRTDAETAKDIVAETLLIAWRRLEAVPVDSELPWCYAVAGHLVSNARRSARRQQGLIARIIQIDRPRAVEPVDAALPDPAVHRALAQLRPQDRELLRLWAWEDLAAPDIAAVLGVSVNAVNIRLHRARHRLAQLLSEPAGKVCPGAGHKPVKDRRS